MPGKHKKKRKPKSGSSASAASAASTSTPPGAGSSASPSPKAGPGPSSAKSEAKSAPPHPSTPGSGFADVRWASQLYEMRDRKILSPDPEYADYLYRRIVAAVEDLYKQMLLSGEQLAEAGKKDFREAGFKLTVLHIDGKDVKFPPRLKCRGCQLLHPSDPQRGKLKDPCAGTVAAHVRWCSGCWAVVYCDRECQRRDWRAGGHKSICHPDLGLIAEDMVNELSFTACRMWLATLQLMVASKSPARRPLVSNDRRFATFKGWQQRVFAEVIAAGLSTKHAQQIEQMVGRPLKGFANGPDSFCTEPACRSELCMHWRKKLAERGISGPALRPGTIYSDEFKIEQVLPGVYRVFPSKT